MLETHWREKMTPLTHNDLCNQLSLFAAALLEVKTNVAHAKHHLVNNQIADSAYLREKIYKAWDVIEDFEARISQVAGQDL